MSQRLSHCPVRDCKKNLRPDTSLICILATDLPFHPDIVCHCCPLQHGSAATNVHLVSVKRHPSERLSCVFVMCCFLFGGGGRRVSVETPSGTLSLQNGNFSHANVSVESSCSNACMLHPLPGFLSFVICAF